MSVPSFWVAGFDPGKSGAAAFLEPYAGQLAVFDMPLSRLGKRDQVDAAQLAGICSLVPLGHAVIEAVHAMPRDGAVQAFSFGRSRGVIEGTVAALEIPTTLVDPAVWKRQMRVTADKDVSRARASQLFPACVLLWTAKSHDGRAEAALLALYGALSLGITPTVKVMPHGLPHPSAVKPKALKAA